uniref:Myelin protein P0 n=1 Tax=Leptobrachium leishanense TaxID=445787 RepID=A0A8C5LP86_9ANUR
MSVYPMPTQSSLTVSIPHTHTEPPHCQYTPCPPRAPSLSVYPIPTQSPLSMSVYPIPTQRSLTVSIPHAHPELPHCQYTPCPPRAPSLSVYPMPTQSSLTVSIPHTHTEPPQHVSIPHAHPELPHCQYTPCPHRAPSACQYTPCPHRAPSACQYTPCPPRAPSLSVYPISRAPCFCTHEEPAPPFSLTHTCPLLVITPFFPRSARWVTALELYAPDELFAENGTDIRLPCTFKSTEVTSMATVVIWKRKGQTSASSDVTIWYYSHGSNFPGKDDFKDRISWAGDLNKRDVSIKIKNIQFKDNGTYECQVFNPPDVNSVPKKIKLRVVEKENLPVSNVPYLVGIICGVIGGVLLIAILIFALVICKKKQSRKHYSGAL